MLYSLGFLGRLMSKLLRENQLALQEQLQLYALKAFSLLNWEGKLQG